MARESKLPLFPGGVLAKEVANTTGTTETPSDSSADPPGGMSGQVELQRRDSAGDLACLNAGSTRRSRTKSSHVLNAYPNANALSVKLQCG